MYDRYVFVYMYVSIHMYVIYVLIIFFVLIYSLCVMLWLFLVAHPCMKFARANAHLICVHMQVCVRAYVRACLCMCLHTHIHTYIYMFILIYTNTYPNIRSVADKERYTTQLAVVREICDTFVRCPFCCVKTCDNFLFWRNPHDTFVRFFLNIFSQQNQRCLFYIDVCIRV